MGIFGGWGKSSDEKAKELLLQETPAELIAEEAASTPAPAADEINAETRFFKQPTPLSPKAHADLKVARRPGDFAYASMVSLAPIAFSEIGPASLCYPIIFSENTRLPYAVMGFRGGRNLFIAADGKLDPSAYAPAHLRRYPFMLIPVSETEGDVLGLDMGSDRVGAETGEPLFEDGRPAAVCRAAFGFLQELRKQEAIAKQAVGRLVDEKLMEVKSLRLPAAAGAAEEQRQSLTFLGLNEAKMNELGAAQLGELAKSGALAIAYAHFNSLHNWRKLLRRLAR